MSVFSSAPKLPPQCSSSCVWKLAVWTGLLFFLLFSCRRVLQKVEPRTGGTDPIGMFLQLLSAGCSQWEELGERDWEVGGAKAFLPVLLSPRHFSPAAGRMVVPSVINELAYKQGQQIRSPHSSTGKWGSPGTQGGLRAWAVRLSSSGQTYLSVIR